jgi:hypothetical protein
MKRSYRNAKSLIFNAALFISTLAALAADPATNAPPKKKWDSNITIGTTLTRGNSKTFLASGAANTKRTWTKDEVLFGASAGYGENQTTTGGTKTDTVTDSYIKGYGQYNHLFTSNFYGGLRLTGEHDDVAHLAYRTTVGPLAGYYFVKQTNAFLCGEIGPSYVREKFRYEDVHNYIALRIGERGEYKFSTGAKIWESVEWLPKISDFSNYLVNAELGTSAPLTKALSVSLVLQDSYKSVPAAGKLKNDLKLIAGLTYNF